MCYIKCYTISYTRKETGTIQKDTESAYITELYHDGIKPLMSYPAHASQRLQRGGTIESDNSSNNVSCVNNFQFICVKYWERNLFHVYTCICICYRMVFLKYCPK